MICSHCGKELQEGAKFCIHCGAPAGYGAEPRSASGVGSPSAPDPQTTGGDTGVFAPEPPPTHWEDRPSGPSSPPPSFSGEEASVPDPPRKKRTIRKRWFVLIGLLVVLAAAAAVVFLLYTSPSAEFARAVKAGDIATAYEIYERDLEEDGLSEKMVQMLADAATQTQEAYLANTLSYDEASTRLSKLAEFPDDTVKSAVDAARTTISNKHQIDALLQSAEASTAAGDYLAAMEDYQSILDLDPSSEAAAKGLESAKSAHQQSVVDQAYDAKDAGKWEDALEILDTYQKTYGENEAISSAYAEIEKQRPVTLKNLTMVSSDHVEVIEEATKDRWDNLYDGAVEYYNDAYGYYSLEKKFTRFTGVIFVSPEANNGIEMSVTIYKDDEIAYHLDNITENTPPATFDIDLSGASTLKIVTTNNAALTSGRVLLGNTAFDKAA